MALSDSDREKVLGRYNYVLSEEQLPSDLTCNICHDVVRTERHCPGCNAHFCEGCLDQWFNTQKANGTVPCTCPNCRKKLRHSDVLHDPKFQAQLSALEVYCKHKAQGCNAVSNRSLLALHLSRECLFESIQCGHCGLEGQRRDIQAHVLSCSMRPVPCKNAALGCQVQVPASLMTEHLARSCEYEPQECRCCRQPVQRKDAAEHAMATCPAYQVCPYRLWGCAFAGSADDVAAHAPTCQHAAARAAAAAAAAAAAVAPSQQQQQLAALDWQLPDNEHQRLQQFFGPEFGAAARRLQEVPDESMEDAEAPSLDAAFSEQQQHKQQQQQQQQQAQQQQQQQEQQQPCEQAQQQQQQQQPQEERRQQQQHQQHQQQLPQPSTTDPSRPLDNVFINVLLLDALYDSEAAASGAGMSSRQLHLGALQAWKQRRLAAEAVAQLAARSGWGGDEEQPGGPRAPALAAAAATRAAAGAGAPAAGGAETVAGAAAAAAAGGVPVGYEGPIGYEQHEELWELFEAGQQLVKQDMAATMGPAGQALMQAMGHMTGARSAQQEQQGQEQQQQQQGQGQQQHGQGQQQHRQQQGQGPRQRAGSSGASAGGGATPAAAAATAAALTAAAAAAAGGSGTGGAAAGSSVLPNDAEHAARLQKLTAALLLGAYCVQDVEIDSVPETNPHIHTGYRAFWDVSLLRLLQKLHPGFSIHWRALALLNDMVTGLCRAVLDVMCHSMYSVMLDMVDFHGNSVCAAAQMLLGPEFSAFVAGPAMAAMVRYRDIACDDPTDLTWSSLTQQLGLSFEVGKCVVFTNALLPDIDENYSDEDEDGDGDDEGDDEIDDDEDEDEGSSSDVGSYSEDEVVSHAMQMVSHALGGSSSDEEMADAGGGSSSEWEEASEEEAAVLMSVEGGAAPAGQRASAATPGALSSAPTAAPAAPAATAPAAAAPAAAVAVVPAARVVPEPSQPGASTSGQQQQQQSTAVAGPSGAHTSADGDAHAASVRIKWTNDGERYRQLHQQQQQQQQQQLEQQPEQPQQPQPPPPPQQQQQQPQQQGSDAGPSAADAALNRRIVAVMGSRSMQQGGEVPEGSELPRYAQELQDMLMEGNEDQEEGGGNAAAAGPGPMPGYDPDANAHAIDRNTEGVVVLTAILEAVAMAVLGDCREVAQAEGSSEICARHLTRAVAHNPVLARLFKIGTHNILAGAGVAPAISGALLQSPQQAPLAHTLLRLARQGKPDSGTGMRIVFPINLRWYCGRVVPASNQAGISSTTGSSSDRTSSSTGAVGSSGRSSGSGTPRCCFLAGHQCSDCAAAQPLIDVAASGACSAGGSSSGGSADGSSSLDSMLAACRTSLQPLAVPGGVLSAPGMLDELMRLARAHQLQRAIWYERPYDLNPIDAAQLLRVNAALQPLRDVEALAEVQGLQAREESLVPMTEMRAAVEDAFDVVSAQIMAGQRIAVQAARQVQQVAREFGPGAAPEGIIATAAAQLRELVASGGADGQLPGAGAAALAAAGAPAGGGTAAGPSAVVAGPSAAVVAAADMAAGLVTGWAAGATTAGMATTEAALNELAAAVAGGGQDGTAADVLAGNLSQPGGYTMSEEAVTALHLAAEGMLVHVMRAAQEMALHAGRQEVTPADLHMALRVTGQGDLLPPQQRRPGGGAAYVSSLL